MKKRILAFISAIVMAITTISVYSFSVSADDSDSMKIVVLGDSISTGYGLDNKDYSYANLVADYYGAEIKNYAVDGMKSSELLSLVNGGTLDADLSDADVILVTIGGNDTLAPAMDCVNEVAEANGIDINAFDTLKGMLSGFSASGDAKDQLIDDLCSKLAKTIDTYDVGNSYLQPLFAKLATYSNSKIIFQTVYNPLDVNTSGSDWDYTGSTDTELYRRRLKNINLKMNGYTDSMQFYINKFANLYDNITYEDVYEDFKGHGELFTNIESVDIHPNQLGHLYIASSLISLLGDETSKSLSDTNLKNSYDSIDSTDLSEALSISDVSAKLNSVLDSADESSETTVENTTETTLATTTTVENTTTTTTTTVTDPVETTTTTTTTEPIVEKPQTATKTTFSDGAEGYASEDYEFVVNTDGTLAIRTYKGTDKNIMLPKSVTISDDNSQLSVTKVAKNAFQTCSVIENVVIPNSYTTLDKFAFQNCSNLKSISLPNSITDIELSALSGCTSLESCVIPESVTTLKNKIFGNCTSLKTVEIKCPITYVGAYMFSGCKSLETVILPEGITEYQMNCFENCTSLKDFEIPLSVTTIDADAFSGCDSLSVIKIPVSVKTIDSTAFSSCGDYIDDFYNTPVHDFTIVGVEGSAAETYATENNEKFMTYEEYDAYLAQLEEESREYESRENSVYNTETTEISSEESSYDSTEATTEETTEATTEPVIVIDYGDVIDDNKVDSKDAVKILIAYANRLAKKDTGLTEEQTKVADVNYDGVIDSKDAVLILKYYALKLANTISCSMEEYADSLETK